MDKAEDKLAACSRWYLHSTEQRPPAYSGAVDNQVLTNNDDFESHMGFVKLKAQWNRDLSHPNL